MEDLRFGMESSGLHVHNSQHNRDPTVVEQRLGIMNQIVADTRRKEAEEEAQRSDYTPKRPSLPEKRAAKYLESTGAPALGTILSRNFVVPSYVA